MIFHGLDVKMVKRVVLGGCKSRRLFHSVMSQMYVAPPVTQTCKISKFLTCKIFAVLCLLTGHFVVTSTETFIIKNCNPVMVLNCLTGFYTTEYLLFDPNKIFISC